MANADVATADAKITATNLIIISSIPSNLVEGWINSALPTKSNRPGRRQVGFLGSSIEETLTVDARASPLPKQRE